MQLVPMIPHVGQVCKSPCLCTAHSPFRKTASARPLTRVWLMLNEEYRIASMIDVLWDANEKYAQKICCNKLYNARCQLPME